MTTTEKIIITSVTGISVMTGSSYAISALFNKNFKEPQHLEKMVKRLYPHLPQPILKFSGWAAHYAMGLMFASVYVALWEHRKIKPTLANAIALGSISGIFGWLIWKASFKYHPFPPFLHYKRFYSQRIPAHVIFAVAATVAYRIIDKGRYQI